MVMKKLLDFKEIEDFSYDAAGRIRTSQISTLFDGKTLNADNLNLWHSTGTGTSVFSNNMNTLSVTSGQYLIRQSNFHFPYFSGKSQLVEMTFDNFAPQANIVKRVGYFSSSAVAPYDTVLDGFFIESSNNSIFLKIYNNGSELVSLDWTLWDNYNDIKSYNWNNFSIIMFDFLWLGGKDLRLFIETPDKSFKLAHTYNHAGTINGTFIKSPNQPLRYEIRSSTGTGSFKAICSQVSSEGSISENSEMMSIYNATSITCNAIGTIYALKGVKKQTTFKDLSVRISNLGVINTATTDAGIILLLKDPTLSAPLSYVNNGRIQEGTATNQTVTSVGYVIIAIPVSSSGSDRDLSLNSLAYLQNKVDNTMSEYVLAYMPTTINQSINSTLTITIY